jgi:hypothetical protein
MANPVFIEGFPARITVEYFRTRFGQNFPDLLSDSYNELLETSINDIYSMFYGVSQLWKLHEPKLWFDKTQLCFSLLLAWYITDLHPQYAVGVMTAGGIPIKSKSIGGVKVTFGDYTDDSNRHKGQGYVDNLAPLKSNPFGYKAYTMIKSAGRIVVINGRNKNA